MNKLLILIISVLLPTFVFAEDLSFNILSQDKAVVTDVRSEGSDVWIKLVSSHLSDSLTVRISNKNRDFYRTWFNDSIDLVSTGFRGNGVWSDRVQTKANYIEYWHADKLILHLERK